MTEDRAHNLLTIFSCPKAFEGRFETIQRNAIESWTALDPTPEVMLFGDDAGTADAAEEYGAIHKPEVPTTPSGTPMLDYIFKEADRSATGRLLCYANADIIFLPDLLDGAPVLEEEFDDFLAIGQRWNLDVQNSIRPEKGEWPGAMRRRVSEGGTLFRAGGLDHFLFPRGLFRDIPAFAIGRPYWDTWMVYNARMRRIPVVDTTFSITAVHQNHDYSHHEAGLAGTRKGSDAQRNAELSNEKGFSVYDATHKLENGEVQRAVEFPYLFRRVLRLPEFYPRLQPVAEHLRSLRDWTRPIRHKIGLTKAVWESRLRG